MKQKIEGVLFDFNGTLFFDTPIHELTWKMYAKKYFNKEITSFDMEQHFHARDNMHILNFLSNNRKLSKEEISYYSNEKTKLYQQNVLNNLNKLKLVDGLEQCLDFLNSNNIKYNIVTASREKNTYFYFNTFPILAKYFSIEKVIYDDGTIKKGKPDPEFYLKGASSINTNIKNCLVIEDSYSGLLSGINSNPYQVIAINNGNNLEQIKKLNIKVTINDLFGLIEYIKSKN